MLSSWTQLNMLYRKGFTIASSQLECIQRASRFFITVQTEKMHTMTKKLINAGICFLFVLQVTAQKLLPFRLTDTGQITGYSSTQGEDADLVINPMSFTDNGDGTATISGTPTGSAGITASFKRYDDCKGNPYTLFTIVNTGGTPLRSAYMRVTDLKTGQFTEWSADAFDLWQGCIIAQNYAPLNPGSIGYLRSGQFAKNPRGDKMRAVIHACTQKGLRGFCVDIAVLFQ